ncbi:hypothetical protein WJX74_003989 [Apatococcus lobatus]|uniref:Hint domain-containing protein n=1 Tax=Apatococcus lobatus TaxID=904363 RepID=A0AAW1RLM5_9CHLO
MLLSAVAVQAQLAPETLPPAAAPIQLAAAGVSEASAGSAPTYPAAPGYAPGPVKGVPNAASAPGFSTTIAGAESSGVDTSAGACYNSQCGEMCSQTQARLTASSGTTVPVLLQVGTGSNAACTDSTQYIYTCCEQTCSTNTDCSTQDYCGTAPGSSSSTGSYCFGCNCTTGSPNAGVDNSRCKQECAVAYASSLVGNTTNSTSCFPGSAVVSTPMGMQSISSLRIGDKVLTLTPSGQAVYEQIFVFSHRAQKEAAMFTSLTSKSGHKLAATPGHYIWAAKPGQKASIIRMGDVEVGDEILTSALSEGDRELRSPVVHITTERQEGLYNPHTASGSIIVNGVAATAFTDVLPPSTAVYKAVMLPFRAMSFLIPSKAMALAVNDAVLNLYFGSSSAMLRSLVGASAKL